MKISRKQLRQIIREQVEQHNSDPDHGAPEDIPEDIKKVASMGTGLRDGWILIDASSSEGSGGGYYPAYQMINGNLTKALDDIGQVMLDKLAGPEDIPVGVTVFYYSDIEPNSGHEFDDDRPVLARGFSWNNNSVRDELVRMIARKTGKQIEPELS